MSALIFDGKTFAQQKESVVAEIVTNLKSQGISPRVFVVLFHEDEGSVLYTRLKTESAERVGIVYESHSYSMTDDVAMIVRDIHKASGDPAITGVMVQKPTTRKWMEETQKSREEFKGWWETLIEAIDVQKDVDCLTKTNVEKIYTGQNTQLLPATVKACVAILFDAKKNLHISEAEWNQKTALVIGRSDIIGKPLASYLASQFSMVKNIGKRELESDPYIGKDFDVLICAVGVEQLITADMIKPGAIVIDVGAPKNDIDRESVEKVASFLTPVPGGVGPVTVVSLMENVVTVLES